MIRKRQTFVSDRKPSIFMQNWIKSEYPKIGFHPNEVEDTFQKLWMIHENIQMDMVERRKINQDH